MLIANWHGIVRGVVETAANLSKERKLEVALNESVRVGMPMNAAAAREASQVEAGAQPRRHREAARGRLD